MKVKKYTSATMKEALAQIRAELGEDALIISTREMTAPLGKKFIEVTAAAEDRQNPEKNLSAERKKENRAVTAKTIPSPVDADDVAQKQINQNRALLAETLKPLKDELFTLRTMVDELRRSKPQSAKDVDLEPLQEEVRSLKRLVSNLSKSARSEHLTGFPLSLRQFYQGLVANEVEESIAFGLIEVLQRELDDEKLKDSKQLTRTARAFLEKTIPQPKPVILNQNRPTIMAFIGPTGVGKTTTIAKLAARCTLQMKKKVTLITIDTYRIAAVEQLKTYARIMDLPIFVCYSNDEMRQTIEASSDSSLILIDTAGHSQADEEQVRDLKSYFDAEDIEVLLVLSATTKASDLQDITERFGSVNPHKLVFTKLDETTTFGPILNETVRTKLPVGYLTAGQNVPDDIETASPAKLARLIVGGNT